MNTVLEPKVNVENVSTLCIPLFDGKIKSKSRVNLQKFVDSLDSNLKKAIVEPVLNSIGLTVIVNGDDTEVAMQNQELLKEYYDWRVTKINNLQKLIKPTNVGKAEKL